MSTDTSFFFNLCQGSVGTKQYIDICRDKMDTKMQQSAPLLVQEETVDSRLEQTVKKEQNSPKATTNNNTR